jgi:bifunctional enzyme CysN/CysC
MADAGVIAIVALISPYAADRGQVRRSHRVAGLPFLEIFVDTPREVCEARDTKGMYARARAGEITGFTGVDDPYEPPRKPDLRLRPEDGDAATNAARVVELIDRLQP